jgi:hypothetical protein
VTRLYLPATLHVLSRLEQAGTIPVGDDVVMSPDDSEDAEYDALMTAAETSAVLADELDPGERRRVVIVAEVPEVAAAGTSVSLSDVVAVHADADDMPSDADPEALDDLCWYATQEIPDLLG